MQQTTMVLGGRYEVSGLLGHGGMARVYRGTDRRLTRPVAVKVLAEPYDRDREFVRRFRREAVAAARLNHPNIVAVYDSGSDHGIHYIVMELVEGQTLADRLRRDGTVPAGEAARIGADVARALAEAHERGVVHRDVKPGNVMLTDGDRVKVVDFGIARASGATEITRSGLLGSAWYVSPEQAQGASGDARSDVYGLGCVLYQMLTGRPPFVGDDPLAALYQHVNEPPPRPSSIRPVPEPLERAVLRCLEKDPARRYTSAREAEADLRRSSAEDPASTIPLPVGDVATAPIAASEPTAPIAASEPTAPIAASEPTAPIETSEPTAPVSVGDTASHRRRTPTGRWRWAGPGLVAAGLLLAVGLVILLDDPLRLPTREAADRRNAAGETVATSAPRASAVPDEPPTVAAAYSTLIETIVAAHAAGGIEGDAASKLRDRADHLLEAYQEGEEEKVAEEFAHLEEELAKSLEEGEVSPDAANAIVSALDRLVLAIEDDPVASQEDDEGGPPPWAEANGHDDEDGD